MRSTVLVVVLSACLFIARPEYGCKKKEKKSCIVEEKKYHKGMSENTETSMKVPNEGVSIMSTLSGSPLASVLSNKESLEALASIYIAKQMPRNMMDVTSKIRQLCSFRNLASTAFFEYKRGGTTITGETIHLANACLTAYGNAEAGWRKIAEHVDEKGRICSDCIAFCWDKENNIRREIAFSVPHWRDTKEGGYALTSDRDIYEICANMASRRIRACIWAVLPDFIRQEAAEACQATLRSSKKPIEERINDCVFYFSKIGVNKEMLEAYLKHKVETSKESEIIMLIGLFNAIRTGAITKEEAFANEEDKTSDDPIFKKKESNE